MTLGARAHLRDVLRISAAQSERHQTVFSNPLSLAYDPDRDRLVSSRRRRQPWPLQNGRRRAGACIRTCGKSTSNGYPEIAERLLAEGASLNMGGKNENLAYETTVRWGAVGLRSSMNQGETAAITPGRSRALPEHAALAG